MRIVKERRVGCGSHVDPVEVEFVVECDNVVDKLLSVFGADGIGKVATQA